MPVSNEDSVAGPYYPNGGTKDFAFSFKAASASEVVAVHADGSIISQTLYSVTLDSDEGGSLSFVSAPAASDFPVIYVVSEPAITQPDDFDNTGPSFNPRALTRALDRGAVIAQKLKREIGQGVRFPFGETAQVLPPAAQRAGRFLAFGAMGDVIPSDGTGADSGLRTDLATGGGAIIGTDRGVDLETELADRGLVVDGQTLTTPLLLDPGKKYVGRGRADRVLMSGESSGVVTPQPVSDYNYFSETRDFFVQPAAAFVDCGDYARDIDYSAYGIDWNNKFWGGQKAAVRYRNCVGHMEFNTEAARSKVGHLFEIVSGIQSTVNQFYGGTTNLIGDAIRADGQIAFLSYKNRAFDQINELVADAGIINGLHFDTCWFEGWGRGNMTFTEAGGRVTGYAFTPGDSDGKLYLGSAKRPVFSSSTFVGNVTISGGFAPVLTAPHCVLSDCIVQPDGAARGVFHMKHMTGPGSGTVGLDQLTYTLPEYGEAGTMLEHFGVSASHTSLAIAEIAGVGFATGMGHENLYTSEMDGGAWAYKTATLTAGRPDPWGGTSAFAFSGAAGQHYGNFYLPPFDGGGKFCIQFLLRAQAADSRIMLSMESTGANAYKHRNIYHFTDTRWRIITLRGDLPASGSYTSFISIVAGTFDIAASQCSAGYDAPPILRGGQSVTGAYTQIDRRIVKRGTAIPVAGKWWAGDEIIYDAATANTRKRRGAICTVGDGTGVGTWVEYGFVANMGAAIPNIGGAPTAADYNAVLAVLRAMGGIAP